MSDTIFALSTAKGRGALSVIRVSGANALISLQKLIGTKARLPIIRQASVRKISQIVSRETIDEALIIRFEGPNSFTGEDLIEYHIHGGRAITQELLEELSKCENHRMAEPGEFTKRAFINGKLDLTQAEAIADLIDAETQAQKNQALKQLNGDLLDLYEGWTKDLTAFLAHIEADIDFPDEDLPEGVADQVRPKLVQLIENIEEHLNDNRRGERLRDGIQVAIIGAPNAGKSSLANVLAQREVAIVSNIAGTTRDIIEVHLDLAGYPVILADTAGLRPDQIGQNDHDKIENIGIERALKKAESADIKLLLFNGVELPDLDMHTLALADENAIVVINKMDLYEGTVPQINSSNPICISTKDQSGIDKLLTTLISKVEEFMQSTSEAPSLTRQRHREALSRSIEHLKRALKADLPELMAEDVRLSIRDLGRITGRVDVEDLLDVIFNDFCIGK